MTDEPVTISLRRAQALVLFEWLSRCDDEESLPFWDPSEQKVLWILTGQLEKVLVEPLQQDYGQIIERARKTVNQED